MMDRSQAPSISTHSCTSFCTKRNGADSLTIPSKSSFSVAARLLVHAFCCHCITVTMAPNITDQDWDEVEKIPDDVADLPHFDMPLVKTPSLPPPTPASLITRSVSEVIDEIEADDIAHQVEEIAHHVEDIAHLIMLDAPLACDENEDQEFLLHPEHTPTKDEERVIEVLRYMRFLICVAATGGFTSGYSSGTYVALS